MPATIPGYHPSPSPGARAIAATNSSGELITADQLLTQHLINQNATAQTGMTATAIPGTLAGTLPSVSYNHVI